VVRRSSCAIRNSKSVEFYGNTRGTYKSTGDQSSKHQKIIARPVPLQSWSPFIRAPMYTILYNILLDNKRQYIHGRTWTQFVSKFQFLSKIKILVNETVLNHRNFDNSFVFWSWCTGPSGQFGPNFDFLTKFWIWTTSARVRVLVIMSRWRVYLTTDWPTCAVSSFLPQ